MNLSQNVNLKQEQKLSPQMLQGLNLLQMPIFELRSHIIQEITNNPALEIPDSPVSTEDFPDNVDSNNDNDYYNDDDYFNEEEYLYKKSSSNDDSDKFKKMLENTSDNSDSLQEHLLKQLEFTNEDNSVKDAARLLIGNLNQEGFFIHNLSSLFENSKLSSEVIQKAVKLVQSFDPSGICCANERESLVIQARARGMIDSDLEIFKKLIYEYLEEIAKGDIKSISRITGITEDDLNTFISILKQLSLHPAANFSSNRPQYIVPEFSIYRKNDKLFITMNNKDIPKLAISPEFKNLTSKLPNKTESKEAKKDAEYINQKIKDAENLIYQIDRRNSSMVSLAKSLCGFQKDFFMKGKNFLKVLTMKDIANDISMHESTVSRLVKDKWIDTDWGLFPLEYFFPKGIDNSENKTILKKDIKETIQEIISENSKNSQKKLSDQKVSELLELKGIKCARRTVNKYRKELNI